MADTDDAFPKIYENIFAFGDVCITPANEPKTIVSLYQYKKEVATNIVNQLKGVKNASKFRQIPEIFTEISNIPLGSKMGLLVINDRISFNAGNAKKKIDIETEYMKVLRNDLMAYRREQLKFKMIDCVVRILDLPVVRWTIYGSRNKKKAKRDEDKKQRVKDELLRLSCQ